MAFFSFGESQDGYAQIRVAQKELDDHAYELLSMLEGDRITIPPVDRLLGSIQAPPEVTLAALRACEKKGFTSYESGARGTTHSWTITAAGQKMVSDMRKARRRHPKAIETFEETPSH
jgi:DNA-binding PadR family transcriptional regulator